MKEETQTKVDRKARKNPPEKGQKKKKKGNIISTILLIVILVAGLGVLGYPKISDWWNSMHATQAVTQYQEVVEELSPEEKEAMLEAARAYNASLSLGVHFTLTDAEFAEYMSLLNLTDTGMMGYIQIPSINVNLPIYHTVEESVLQIGAGHIPGSSLPVGGESTHSVVSGHRGLPSMRLFTDLDRLVEGDVFTLTVLDQTITYMVDQIRIVLPEETQEMAIVEGGDYCTLVTCTPYGINTHRMLVRGRRIDNLDEGAMVTSDATRIPTYIVVPAVGIPLLFILLIIMLIYYRKKKPRKSDRELLDEFKNPNHPDL